MHKWVIFASHDKVIISIDKNLQGPKTYLCTKFGCSVADCVGGVGGQRNKYVDMHYGKFYVLF